MRVESDVLFRPRNNEAVAVLRQCRRNLCRLSPRKPMTCVRTSHRLWPVEMPDSAAVRQIDCRGDFTVRMKASRSGCTNALVGLGSSGVQEQELTERSTARGRLSCLCPLNLIAPPQTDNCRGIALSGFNSSATKHYSAWGRRLHQWPGSDPANRFQDVRHRSPRCCPLFRAESPSCGRCPNPFWTRVRSVNVS